MDDDKEEELDDTDDDFLREYRLKRLEEMRAAFSNTYDNDVYIVMVHLEILFCSIVIDICMRNEDHRQ